MTEVIRAVGTFFTYAVAALFAQNAIFSRALGVSRLVKMAEDDTDPFMFGVLLCVLQLISALLGFFLNRLCAPFSVWLYLRPLGMVACSAAAFGIVLVAAVALSRNGTADIVSVLPMATFNTCILGTMMIATTLSFTLVQTLGFALGSGLGYVLAVWLVRDWRQRMDDEAVPATFRGLPITLLYIGILALAVYGLTGHMLAF